MAFFTSSMARCGRIRYGDVSLFDLEGDIRLNFWIGQLVCYLLRLVMIGNGRRRMADWL